MIKFNTGEIVDTLSIISSIEVMAGHKRKIAIITTSGIGYNEAAKLFIDGAIWSIIEKTDNENIEYDSWNEYTKAGSITDNRDGTLTIKMGYKDSSEQEALNKVKTSNQIIEKITGRSIESIDDAKKIRADVEMIFKSTTMDDDNKIRTDYLCPVWQAGDHKKGENYTANNQIWECYQSYDNAKNPDIEPNNPSWLTFNRPLHGKTIQTACKFIPVQGSYDMYRVGEYMIYTDNIIYKCIQDTNFSPDDYSEAWEKQE